jgi:hypothetical protein
VKKSRVLVIVGRSRRKDSDGAIILNGKDS